MSNKRKITRIKVPNPSAEAMYQASRHAELVINGGKAEQPTMNRRIQRALRKTVPLAAYLTDHSKPHVKEENCGRKCVHRG